MLTDVTRRAGVELQPHLIYQKLSFSLLAEFLAPSSSFPLGQVCTGLSCREYAISSKLPFRDCHTSFAATPQM